ncbi:uncharacterized protein LOC129590721 isoform X2 [Paramacrobiotus metropolitanus]|uniref:uncharacterized protein LOC129590721 isoform X2 n=1 Tax=Paramacrobiotus metropolitanus TaxID=2943436 RepID=UPI0024462D1B|nr:uncharacterized protein LOC129590721 isoform X2 [Paramacrobiotus metropolitanus]
MKVVTVQNVQKCDMAAFLREARQNQNLLNGYKKIVNFVESIAEGLDFLHNIGIIHGDLKPENILVKVAGSGCKTFVISDLDDTVQLEGSVTRSADISQLRGTIRYMSPEVLKKLTQLEAEAPGRKTDIWSLGCIILELAQISSGERRKRLIKSGNVVDIEDNLTENQYAAKIIEGFVPYVSEDNAPLFAGLIRKCLNDIAAERISAKEILFSMLKEKEVIVFFAYGCKVDRTFLVLLLDPATGSLNAQIAATKLSPFIWLSTEFRQLSDTEILFAERVDLPNSQITKLHFWNAGEGTWRELTLSSGMHLDTRLVMVNRKGYYWDRNGHFTELDTYTGRTVTLNSPLAKTGVDFSVSAAARCGKRIYYGTPFSLHQYDTVADEWEALQKLPIWLTEFAMAVVNSYVYIIGGRVSGDARASAGCIRQNMNNRLWEEMKPLRQPRYRHAACVIKEKIYVCGGIGAKGEHALTVEFYDTKCDEGWSTVGLRKKGIQLLSDLVSKCTEHFEFMSAMSVHLDGDIAAVITQ